MDLLKCRCCGDFTIEEYDNEEICSTCWWHDEILQWKDPDYIGGPNGASLNDYRKKWIESQTVRGVFIHHYKTREIFPLKIKWTEEQINVLKKCAFSFDPFESMTENQIVDELRDMVCCYLSGCFDENCEKGVTEEGVICDDIIDVVCAIEKEFVDKYYLEEDSK